MNKKVSIIVPIYNSEITLEKCIESIIKQTYSNLEIILIDNNSTDRSLDICKKYQIRDKRIIIQSQSKQGVSYARNLGLKISSGDYITFADSDDYLCFDAIENMVKFVNEYEVDVVRTCYYSQRHELEKNLEYNKVYNKSEIKSTLIEKLLNQTLPGYLWCLLIKSDIAKKITFNGELYVHQDMEYCLKLFLNINKIYLSSKITYNYTYFPNGSTSPKYYNRNIYSLIKLNSSLKNILENNDLAKGHYLKSIDILTYMMINSYLEKIYNDSSSSFIVLIKELKHNLEFIKLSKIVHIDYRYIILQLSIKSPNFLYPLYLKVKKHINLII